MPKRISIPNLYAALRKLLDQIPHGRVTTYGDLAEALGSISSARWVGEFMAHHEHEADCNCHRVIRRTGEIGIYVTGDPNEKSQKLREEHIDVGDTTVDLERFGFTQFKSRFPLKRLLRLQNDIGSKLVLKGYRPRPDFVAGVDLSYEKKSPGAPSYAFATYAVVETRRLKLVDSVTIRKRVKFPYIPGFLSYREAPILLDLLDKVAKTSPLAEVVLVDGNGILHPRRAGIATFLGVQTDIRTVGVGKSLLCGTVEEDGSPADVPKPIRLDGKQVGYAVGNNADSSRIFVSPGHRMTIKSSLRVVCELFGSHRIPEPVFHADRISREAAKEHAKR
ncbi:MAG: endonuclease V [Planctomycetaceae bacterium]